MFYGNKGKIWTVTLFELKELIKVHRELPKCTHFCPVLQGSYSAEESSKRATLIIKTCHFGLMTSCQRVETGHVQRGNLFWELFQIFHS